MKILVTGGTNGIGKGVAKALAGMDNQEHEVILLCRSKELGEAVIREFEEITLNKKCSYILCDLTRLSDVKKAIAEIKSKHQYLDSIFINAGLGYAPKRVETVDQMDAHFQVNYLSQFMLTLNLLSLLENSKNGGRIIFNVTEFGEIFWDDLQLKEKWGYETGIKQAMAAKRMFLLTLHRLYSNIPDANISFIGYRVPKTVWTNQLNIIPPAMRIMATIMKFFGTFISIDTCGQLLAPLLVENQNESLKKSGKFLTSQNNFFTERVESAKILDVASQDRLWAMSLALCADAETSKIVTDRFKDTVKQNNI